MVWKEYMKHGIQFNTFELVLGSVLVVLCCFLFGYFVYSNTGNHADCSNIKACFININGVIKGTDIKLAGVKIGEVSTVFLDPLTYNACLNMCIQKNIKIPEDTSVLVSSDGFLSSKFIALDIGASTNYISNGGELYNTQSPVNLEGLITKFIMKQH